MALQQMEEKNERKRVMVCLTFFGKISQIATTTTVASRCGNHETSTQLTSNLALTLGSSHLRNVLVALSHPLYIDKNYFFSSFDMV